MAMSDSRYSFEMTPDAAAEMEMQKSGETGQNRSTMDGSVDLWGRPSDKLKTGSWKSAVFIYGLCLTDSLSTVAIAINIFSYLLEHLQLSQAEASTIASNFMGVTFVLALFWGFVADAFLGRFLTISVTSFAVVAGSAMLTVQAANPSKQQFLAGLFLMAVGSAGIKPCIASLGQDQFDEAEPRERKQQAHFFTGFYGMINLGVMIGVTLITYIATAKSLGWKWAFGVASAFIALGIVFFWMGTPFYRHQKPTGSALTRLAQVFVAAYRNRHLPVPADASELHEQRHKEGSILFRTVPHSNTWGLRFLDKAAISRGGVEDNSPWQLCTVTQVEDLKTIILILPIWLTNIVVYTLFAQLLSFTVAQASSMQRAVGPNFVIPPSSFSIFLSISAIISMLVWELLVVPLARRFSGKPLGFSHLQRIGIGLTASIFAMVSSALVERKRVQVIQTNLGQFQSTGEVPMSAFYLLPCYIILGFVEFVIGVAQLKFFFEEVPDGMKSVGTSLYYSAISMGYFLSTALVNIINHVTRHGPSSSGWLETPSIFTGGLANYFWLLSCLALLNNLLYVLVAYLYRHNKTDVAPM